MTQRELAECSGVSLRMIRAYEQEAQDISKAEAGKVSRLAAVLGTRAEALLDIR
jgi:transcriptional regulator with XRE-family HTH domain